MSEGSIRSNGKEECKCKQGCKSTLVDSVTLSTCNSKSHIPMGSTGPLIAKIPVILSDVEVEINVESEIELEKEHTRLINIDKEVFVKECKLIPYTNKLFIEGYVGKNIQFYNDDCTNKTNEGNKVEYTEVNSTFKCVTEIEFFKKPLYGEGYKERLNSLDKSMICKNNKEDSWVHYSELQEPVYCECQYAKILEIDALNSKDNGMKCLDKKEVCKKILEKMVIFIRLKVIQNQQVFIPEFHRDVMAIESCNNNSMYKCTRNYDKDKSNVTVEFGEKEGIMTNGYSELK